MRTVTYGGACSLDGFLAGPDGSVDWLRFTPEVGEIIAESWRGTDTVLMGRKTWEVAQKAGGGAAMSGVTTYVFSRTLRASDVAGATLVSEDAGGFVRDLKRRKGKGIMVMGGGDLARSLFEADVIDEVGFNVHPVLLGSGIPALLDARRRFDLHLVECRKLPKECVLMRFTVKHHTRSRV
jgi:dihydrofolate reductase